MTSKTSPTSSAHAEQIQITIDGRLFIVEDRHYLARELLSLAGLSAAGYDFTRVGNHGKAETFRDAQKVNVNAVTSTSASINKVPTRDQPTHAGSSRIPGLAQLSTG
ncbi:hypothetical protein ACQPZ2_30875 [Nocardia pseudovaccinii]|uniref:hypothetical protein n=1 Tax=Nocardia pseudovaccinii TaxID=189540 RepID=UPI003D8F956C